MDGRQELGNRTEGGTAYWPRPSRGGLTRDIIRDVRDVRKRLVHVLRPVGVVGAVGAMAGRLLRRRRPHVGGGGRARGELGGQSVSFG
jgi:hypothetical protein